MNAATYSEYSEITIPCDHAGLDAYVVNTERENLENWIGNKGFSEKSLAYIRQFRRVCVIRGIQVEREYRGQGIGSALLNEALDGAELLGAEIAILEADTDESNEFDLVSWYEGYEFSIVEGERNNHPLMVLRLNPRPESK